MKHGLAAAMGISLLSASALAAPVELSEGELDRVTAGAAADTTTDNAADGLPTAVQEVIFPLLEAGGAATVAFLNDPAVQQRLRADPSSASDMINFLLYGLFGELVPGTEGGLLLVPELTKQMIGADEDPEGVTISHPEVQEVSGSVRIGPPIRMIPAGARPQPRVGFGPTFGLAPSQD